MEKVSRYVVVTPSIAVPTSARPVRAVYALRTERRFVVDAEAWDALTQGLTETRSAEELGALRLAKVLVPDDEDELEAVLRENEAAQSEDDQLFVVLQPSSFCSMGCGYCGQSHRKESLGPERIAHIVADTRAQLASGRFRELRVSWFGGEPLLSLDDIRTATTALTRICREHGVQYSASVTTNGVALTHRVAEELVRDLTVDLIEITLDGVDQFHDEKRPLRNGAPSFETVFGNVTRLARSNLPVALNIRCNVDERNVDSVTPLLERLAAHGAAPGIASFYATRVFPWGHHAQTNRLSAEEFADREVGWILDMRRLGFASPGLPRRKRLVCMALRPTAQLIDARGEVFNCTEVSLLPEYESSPQSDELRNRYAIGKIGTPRADDTERPFATFHDGVRRGAYACHDCPVLPVCGGACPKHWFDGHPPCPPVRYNLEQRVLLSVLDDPQHLRLGSEGCPSLPDRRA